MATKRRRAAPLVEAHKIPGIPLPDHIDPDKIKPLTVRGITAYQKKVLAAMTPHLETAWFQSLRKMIVSGDPEALELYAKVTKKIETGRGIQINNTNSSKNNSDNEQRTVQFHGVRSIDQIARTLAENKALTLSAAGAAPTPVSDGQPEEIDSEE